MSDSDSAQRRRPPTIDLTAQEVATEQPADAQEPAGASAASTDGAGRDGTSEPQPASVSRRIAPYLFAGLGGAVVVAAVLVALWFTGLAPPRGNEVSQSASGPSPPAAPDSARMSAIEAQLEKLQGASQTRSPDAGLTPRISDVETQTKALRDSVAALTRRVDEIAASARDLATEGKAAAAAAAVAAEEAKAAGQNKTQSGDLDQITRRLDAIENSVKTLTADAARASASADDHVARAAAAAAALPSPSSLPASPRSAPIKKRLMR
jgi:hypothetical protein